MKDTPYENPSVSKKSSKKDVNNKEEEKMGQQDVESTDVIKRKKLHDPNYTPPAIKKSP